MKTPVAGIVAEYNPFHLGHRYHVEATREHLPGVPVVAVMSSHFAQRGEPALISPHARAEAAMLCGIDLVLELPSVCSCQQAGIFAHCAIKILHATGVVTHVSCGAEEPPDEGVVATILKILIHEPHSFKEKLHLFLHQGYSFVQSRAMALDFFVPGIKGWLEGANNSLALAYRISAHKLPLSFIHIKREGAGYHDPQIDTPTPSATAIRRAVEAKKTASAVDGMPHESGKVLKRELAHSRAVTNSDAMWGHMRFLLERCSENELMNIWGMVEGLHNSMKKNARTAGGYGQFIDMMTSKRYTASRIKRLSVHTLLGLPRHTGRAIQRLGPPFIRVLGANEVGRSVLGRMRQHAMLPVVSRFTCPQDAYSRTIHEHERAWAAMWGMLAGADYHYPSCRAVMI